SSQQSGTPQGDAEARRAADRLKEAQELLSRLRKQQSGGTMDDLVKQADKLADQQQGFDRKMRQTFGTPAMGQQGGQERGASPQQSEQLAGEKQQMLGDLKKLEQEMQRAARDMAATERKASSKLRDALGNMQQEELPLRMQWSADAIRR